MGVSRNSKIHKGWIGDQNIKHRKEIETVCAVVVTYNRKKLLWESLDALLLQTRPLDSIIVIDNASTDGTEEFLKENYLHNPIFDYVRLPENTGGAGGFYKGVKRGYEKGFDWLWLMDDDVQADFDALKNLLKYAPVSKAIQASRYFRNGLKISWGYFFDIRNLIEYKSSSRINVACFEGLLLHRELIEKIGFPDKSFFMVCDDSEYGYRLSKYTNIICAEDAILYRLIQIEDIFEIKSMLNTGLRPRERINIYHYWKTYYYLRNLALIIRKHAVSNVSKMYFLTNTLKYMIGVLLYDDHKPIRLRILLKAFLDGLSGKSGKTLDPQKYKTLLTCQNNKTMEKIKEIAE